MEHGTKLGTVRSPLRILVGDDLKVNRTLLASALECCFKDSGKILHIDQCSSAEEAMILCFPGDSAHGCCNFDIVILDEHMSDGPDAMLGSHALELIRARDARAVLISCSCSCSQDGFVTLAKSRGANALLRCGRTS